MSNVRVPSWKVLVSVVGLLTLGLWRQAEAVIIQGGIVADDAAVRGGTIDITLVGSSDFDLSGFSAVLTFDASRLAFESGTFANGVWNNADYMSASLDPNSPGMLTLAAVADIFGNFKFVPGGMNQPFFGATLGCVCTGPTTIGFGSGENDNVFVDTDAIGHYLANTDLTPKTIDIVTGGTFIRGNARNDPIDVSLPLSAAVNILDGVFLLDYLYANGIAPPCLDAADANNDGRINIVDPIVVFQEVFGNAAVTIPVPFDSFGLDTDASLGCETPPASVCPINSPN